jgi:CheY-like chemotaxis protein
MNATKKVLIADDEDNLRLLVRTTLEDPKYEILEAADGHQALGAVRTGRPDLVVLDWMMPGMSGIEVLRQLREDPATAGIPVIMLTAKAQQKDMDRGRALGARAYLTKPFSPLDLLQQVEEALR